jgi:hypothetical protein
VSKLTNHTTPEGYSPHLARLFAYAERPRTMRETLTAFAAGWLLALLTVQP